VFGRVSLTVARRTVQTAVGVSAAASLTLSGIAPSEAAHSSPQATGIISTVAGGSGGPGLGTKVALDYPCGAAFAAGQMYVGDEFAQQVSPGTGRLTTLAGGVRRSSVPHGEQVPLGDGGPASQAVTSACGMTVDSSGNLIVADGLDHRVRVVPATSGTIYGQSMTAHHIYTVAGSSGAGITGNGGSATKARLGNVTDVKVDRSGNLVVADSGPTAKVPAQVQVVATSSGTFYGRQMTAGDIYKIAGNPKTLQVSGDGGPAAKAGLGPVIGELQLDQAGNVVVADTSASSIRVVAAKNGTFYGQQMKAHDIYTVAGDGKAGSSGDGGPATKAMLRHPQGVAVDGSGNLVIADTHNDRVRVVAGSSGTFYGKKMTAHDIYAVAGCGSITCDIGDGGPALAGRLVLPDGVAVDGHGNLIVAEHGQGRISKDRRVQLVAVNSGTFYGQKMIAGDIYTVAGDGFRGYSGDTWPATRAVIMTTSSRMVVDGAGNVVVAAGENNRLRIVPPRSGTFYGRQMTGGHIYTIAGGGPFPFGGDGGPATRAGMDFPDGLAIDGHGNLVVADEGNNRIRVVTDGSGTFYGQQMKAHSIYTVAGNGKRGFSGDGGPATQATMSIASGVAVDPSGNIVFADDGNSRVRVVAASTGTFYGQHMKAHDIYTVAGDGAVGSSGDGGPATSAALHFPRDLAVDGHGNVLIVDEGSDRVRVVAAASGTFYGKLMTAGHIYTVAGNGKRGFSGDGGPGTQAAMNSPKAVKVDSHGNVLIADQNNNRVRVLAGASGTFYGVPMTAGHMYTVAGNGAPGFSGDGGPAASAKLAAPSGVAVNSAGDLFVADRYRVREITP
jgi:secreted PhoX family phosphatase